jgi:RNA polymerase sigma-70 factor (ECF subfamily)
LIEAHYKELLRFLMSMLHDRHEAQDVAQDAYVRVLASRDAGQAIRDPRPLLYRVARNLLIDRHRRQGVRRHEDIDAHPEMPASDAAEPETVMSSHQHVQAMLAAIEALPPRCREAFILHKFDGLSHIEVASRMGISRNAVEKHVIRALLACRACDDRLSDDGG